MMCENDTRNAFYVEAKCGEKEKCKIVSLSTRHPFLLIAYFKLRHVGGGKVPFESFECDNDDNDEHRTHTHTNANG